MAVPDRLETVGSGGPAMTRTDRGTAAYWPEGCEAVRIAALILVALLLIAAPAAAANVRLHGADGTPLQQWADRAAIPTPNLDVTVSLTNDRCGTPAPAGCAQGAAIYLAWEEHPRRRYRRFIFFHELGHVFDTYVLTDAYRARLEPRLGDGTWRENVAEPLHERFASAYALCATGARRATVGNSTYGYTAGARRHRKTCRIIRQAAQGCEQGCKQPTQREATNGDGECAEAAPLSQSATRRDPRKA